MYYFTNDCLIGIEQIDNDHRKLFDLMNETMNLLDNELIDDKYSQIKSILTELKEYADSHFIREEAHMAAINDPELDIQKKQHAEFRDKIDVLDIAGIDGSQEQQEALHDLMLYLTKWLYSHILGSDILIGMMPPLQEWKKTENPCRFTEEYLTGIPLIDGEHKSLFEIIGEANRLVQDDMAFDKYDDIITILQKLTDYTREHFRDEEEYMESINYPGIEAQRFAHQSFIEKLREVNLEQVDDHQQEYLEELMEYLFNWLSNHILKSDKLIGTVI